MFSWGGLNDLVAAASESLESAKQSLGKLGEQTSELSAQLAEQAKEGMQRASTFVAEQKQEYQQVEHDTELQAKRQEQRKKALKLGCPPWYIKVTAENPEQGPLAPELKIRILKICQDSNNFLMKAPTSASVFEFNMNSALPYANAILREDPVLEQIRFKLVPRKLQEDQFWKNYFYRVQLIRESMGIAKLDLSENAEIPLVEPPRKAIADIPEHEPLPAAQDAPEAPSLEMVEATVSLSGKQGPASHGNGVTMKPVGASPHADLAAPHPPTKESSADSHRTMESSSSYAVVQEEQARQAPAVPADVDVNAPQQGIDDAVDDDYMDTMEPDINHLSDAERQKMKAELGIGDDPEMAALLAGVEDDGEEIDEAEIANIVSQADSM